MIAVGIDVSKSKSTVAVLASDGSTLRKPFSINHNRQELDALVKYLKGLGEPVIVLMEYTGHYHYPILNVLQSEGLTVCLANPLQMKKFGDIELH